ncbi:MAG TPA: acetyl-CoA carboxylase biotin carboxyl carrier protein [Micropepsaceae bacterium]|nr:acetyl-CoA carboxylase biotin carboxyl carrier protein [Micropepsaceae bacterium]
MTTRKSRPLRDRIANALAGDNNPGFDADLVRELAQLLGETGLSEIEIESGGARIRVARGLVAAAMAPAQTAMAPAASAAAAPHTAQSEPVRKGTIVTSPMVGTVYLAAQPGASPFVKVGDAVTDGTLCIIEAMKTMNPVPAPVAGHVAEIFVHDGQPVEFGEPLMRIE